jgi:hypothetical protein
MRSRRPYDSVVDGALDTSQPLELRPEPAAPPLEELRVRRPALDSGRTLEVEPAGDGTDRVTVRAPDGRVELEVVLTERGPVLRFRAAEIALESQGALALRCQELDVHARGGIRQVAGGDLEQVVLGDAEMHVSGDLVSTARSARLESKRGDVRIRANDDVRLNGERVKLNCS